MKGEWYRDAAWDEAAQRDFETRLARARPHNRSQYLRIKGIALRGTHADGAEQLWRRVVAEYPGSLDAASSLEHLGDLARQYDRVQLAEQFYRDLLAQFPDLNGTTHMVEVSLAELLTERDDDLGLGEAEQLLESALDRNRGHFFNDQLFRWNVALARLADRLRDFDVRRSASLAALRVA